MKSLLLLVRVRINFKMIRKIIWEVKKKFVLTRLFRNVHDRSAQCLDHWVLLFLRNRFQWLLLILLKSLQNKRMKKPNIWTITTEKMMVTMKSIWFSEDKSLTSMMKDHIKKETSMTSIHKESHKEITLTIMTKSMEVSKEITDQIWRTPENKNLSNKSIIDLDFCLLFWLWLLLLQFLLWVYYYCSC